MREDYKPGDLSVRLSFGRVYGTGPDRGKIKPGIEITDQTSGKVLTIDLTAEDLAEMLAGGAATVPAARVNGFKGLRDWGKTLETTTRTVKTQPGDWTRDVDQMPHLTAVIAEIEADGFRCDTPRRNNSGSWVIVGRRFNEQP